MTKDEILSRLSSVFRDVFDDETIVISDATRMNDIDDWDSLAHITLITAIESEFGIRFNIKNALRMKSVGEIMDAILDTILK